MIEILSPDFLLFYACKKRAFYVSIEQGDNIYYLLIYSYLLKSRKKQFISLELNKSGFFNKIVHFLFKNKNNGYLFVEKKYLDELEDVFLNNKINHSLFGKLLNYPDCCIKKFCQEVKDDNKLKRDYSYDSAKRYLKQLNGKKDKFNIRINKSGKVLEMPFGFVPCSPSCSNALKIVKDYEKIKEKILV